MCDSHAPRRDSRSTTRSWPRTTSSSSSTVVRSAIASRRLKVGLDALADTPPAIIGVLGPRPDLQRARLGWERGVQAIAISLDAGDHSLPAQATSAAELLGPRPADLLARFDHEEAARAVGHHLGRGQERGLGVEIM